MTEDTRNRNKDPETKTKARGSGEDWKTRTLFSDGGLVLPRDLITGNQRVLNGLIRESQRGKRDTKTNSFIENGWTEG